MDKKFYINHKNSTIKVNKIISNLQNYVIIKDIINKLMCGH